MCLITLAYEPDSAHRLLLSANRDEFFERPTQAMHWWDDAAMLAGKDLRDGGTWLGLSPNGRFAAVTNFREPGAGDVKRTRSRGQLVTDFLCSELSPLEFHKSVRPFASEYGGFNLLMYDGEQFVCASNRDLDQTAVTEIKPGIYGLSNHLFDSPWPKVNSAKTQLAQVMTQGVDHDALLALMQDTHTPADDALPDTGVGIEMERLLGSRFINTDGYGTRATSSVIWTAAGVVSVAELSYLADGTVDARANFEFSVI